MATLLRLSLRWRVDRLAARWVNRSGTGSGGRLGGWLELLASATAWIDTGFLCTSIPYIASNQHLAMLLRWNERSLPDHTHQLRGATRMRPMIVKS